MAARLSLAAHVDLEELAAAARAAGRLGVDTEFMSEGRYRALLCLVGVVVPGADGSVVVADEHEHRELFWAVRGAGANFGVVVS